MGIELPTELAEVAARTGVKWPEADEDKMRETAQVWRETGKKLTALVSDADSVAQTALNTTQGASADAARSHWGKYVQPDTGHLTAVAKGCTSAADKLDHAAEQVGAAKLAIVSNLVPLAKNKDVAEHAAAAGHPTALLGLDTAVKGTAANVANVQTTLVTAVQPTTGVVVDTAQNLVDPNPGVHGHDQRPDVVQHAGNLVHGVPDTGGMVGDLGPAVPPDGPAHPVPLQPEGPSAGGHIEPTTGPITLPGAPGVELSPDAPTPPTGFPVVHDQGVQLASAAPAVLDAPAAPAQAPAAQAPVAQAPVNQPGGGSQFLGAPPPSAAPIGGAPGAPQPAPVSGQPAPGQPAPGPVPAQRGQAPMYASAEPVRQAPPPLAAMPPTQSPHRQERDTVLALWLVRLFPLGHMPVAADRPTRQLPPPSVDFDYAAGMRFEPHDHPESDLIDDIEALHRDDIVESSEPELEAVVDGLSVGHDPLGGQNERDWDRRFVVRPGSGRDTLDIEYAWPPGELFPEGATAPGEPEVLEPGTVIDRFGTPEGRVFAASATAFGRRSLPPSHLSAGYRQYRVLRPLPVWRAVSAAWFGQTGGGLRYRTVYPALDLIALGYLEPADDAGGHDSGENVDEG